MGVPPPRYVTFRDVFTISNSTPFDYRRNFAFRFSVHSSKNMFLLSLLSVTISGFLPLYKAAKWARISWRVLSIWVLILASIASKYSGSWTQALQVVQLCLHFGSDWSERTIIMNDKNDLITSGLLWAGCFYWFNSLFYHEGPNILSKKQLDKTYQWFVPRNQRSYSAHFPPVFSPELPCQKNGRTGFQLLWISLLLLLKWYTLLSCRTCVFRL